jgi:hypothetical protein
VPYSQRFAAVLLDRDRTVLENVAYNGDPTLVRPVPGVKAALDRLRAAGLWLGVGTDQSGVARDGCAVPAPERRSWRASGPHGFLADRESLLKEVAGGVTTATAEQRFASDQPGTKAAS